MGEAEATRLEKLLFRPCLSSLLIDSTRVLLESTTTTYATVHERANKQGRWCASREVWALSVSVFSSSLVRG